LRDFIFVYFNAKFAVGADVAPQQCVRDGFVAIQLAENFLRRSEPVAAWMKSGKTQLVCSLGSLD
jgi:hypothetical protein